MAYQRFLYLVLHLLENSAYTLVVSHHKKIKNTGMDHKSLGFNHKKIDNEIDKGINHLLIIGIDKYSDKSISQLNNAVKDARDVKKIIVLDKAKKSDLE